MLLACHHFLTISIGSIFGDVVGPPLAASSSENAMMLLSRIQGLCVSAEASMSSRCAAADRFTTVKMLHMYSSVASIPECNTADALVWVGGWSTLSICMRTLCHSVRTVIYAVDCPRTK